MTYRYQQLPSLTSWRGIAALAVAVHHANLAWGGWLVPIGNVGWIGVSFFYVLSGFVLTWSFDPGASIRTFYCHRFARIYPLHFASLLLVLAVFLATNDVLGGYVGTALGTGLGFLLVHDWIPGHPEIRQAWNGVSWSLSAETFFYVLAPGLIPMAKRIPIGFLLNAGVCLFAFHLVCGVAAYHFGRADVVDFLYYNPISRIPEFMYGIIAARLVQENAKSLWISTPARVCFLIPLWLYCWLNPENRNPVFMTDLAIPLFFFAIIGSAIADLNAHERFLTQRIMVHIGNASFSLYMLHAILLGALVHALRIYPVEVDKNLLTLGYLFVAVLLSLVVYRLYELPMRKWLLRSFGRESAGSAMELSRGKG